MKMQVPSFKNYEEFPESHSTALKQTHRQAQTSTGPLHGSHTTPVCCSGLYFGKTGVSFRVLWLSSSVPVRAFDTSLTCDSGRSIQMGTTQGLGFSFLFWSCWGHAECVWLVFHPVWLGSRCGFSGISWTGSRSNLNKGCWSYPCCEQAHGERKLKPGARAARLLESGIHWLWAGGLHLKLGGPTWVSSITLVQKYGPCPKLFYNLFGQCNAH